MPAGPGPEPARSRPEAGREPAAPGRVRAIEDLAAGITGLVGAFEVTAG